MKFRAAIVLALMFLSACSSTTFVYNRLDILIPWYLRDYVKLEGDQRSHFDQLLAPLLAWHRQDELPQYIVLIEGLEADLDHTVVGEDIARVSLAMEQAWVRLEERAIGQMLLLGEQLSQQQMDAFVEKLREQQTEYEEKYLSRSDEEYYSDSYDSLKDSAGDFLGRLNAEQRLNLEVASAQLHRSDAAWLAERSRWQDKLQDILRREPEWQQRLRDALAARDDTVSAEYISTYEHNLVVIHEAIAELLNSRTAKQDRRLRNRLENLREDFQTLHDQGLE